MAKRATEPHAKCKHPWYEGVPFCSLCWCQHNGSGCWPLPAPAEPQWIYSGDGLGTWWAMKDIVNNVAAAIETLYQDEDEAA